jgi:transcriptional regulator with XRE-family HTH domain
MNYQVQFGIALQKLRLEKNLTQRQLGNLRGIDRTFISLLERGIRQPSLTTIIDVAAALNLKPSELITIVENRIRRLRFRNIRK